MKEEKGIVSDKELEQINRYFRTVNYFSKEGRFKENNCRSLGNCTWSKFCVCAFKSNY